jgi:spermidine/putrescine transport system substrate-binding protein
MTNRLMPRPSSRRRQMALLVAMSLIALLAVQHLPPAPATAQKVGGQLNYLGWEGYDDKAAFKPMTDQGVVFNTTYIGNNDELIAKFKAGGAGAYDVGNINSRYLGAMVKQGMIMPLDESKLAQHKNLFPAFKDFGRVDGKLYTVPVFFGFTTLCYRTDLVPKPTWDFYKDPKFVGKYGVAPNPLGDIYVWAMVLGKGMDARKWTQDDLKQIKERGMAEFRNAKTLVATPGEQKDLLIRGDVVLTTDCYDAVAAGAVAQGAKVASVIPPGPRKIWVDMYFIFNGAKNVDAGYAYLNTALNPQGQATMAKTMEMNVSNQEAYKLLPADLVKKLGYEQANAMIAGSEFNILPDPDAKAPNVSVRDLYTAFDEIKAAVKK